MSVYRVVLCASPGNTYVLVVKEGIDMNPFTAEVVAIIRSIPAGKVMTYGQIAAMAGNRRGARQVVRILHSMSRTYDLPWHRVINSRGEIAVREDESVFLQRAQLEEEGVAISVNGRIDLAIYQHLYSEGESNR